MRRTPGGGPGGGGASRTLTSSASAPSSDTMTGLRSISATSGTIVGEPPDPHERDPRARRRRPRACRGSRRAAATTATSARARATSRSVSGRIRSAVSRVSSAATPADAEQHERPERRVVGHADDRLDAGRDHRLHDRATHLVAEAGAIVEVRRPDLAGVGQPQPRPRRRRSCARCGRDPALSATGKPSASAAAAAASALETATVVDDRDRRSTGSSRVARSGSSHSPSGVPTRAGRRRARAPRPRRLPASAGTTPHGRAPPLGVGRAARRERAAAPSGNANDGIGAGFRAGASAGDRACRRGRGSRRRRAWRPRRSPPPPTALATSSARVTSGGTKIGEHGVDVGIGEHRPQRPLVGARSSRTRRGRPDCGRRRRPTRTCAARPASTAESSGTSRPTASHASAARIAGAAAVAHDRDAPARRKRLVGQHRSRCRTAARACRRG